MTMDKNNDFFQLFKVLEAQHTPISRKVSDEKRQEAFLLVETKCYDKVLARIRSYGYLM